MPINLDQTGPEHLLSTDDDGLILNGSPVISKSIHVSNIEPKTYFGDTNKKLLWLDTGVVGTSIFPIGGAANYILRTDGNGTLSWIPPSSIDATKFRYIIDFDNTNNTVPLLGKIKFVRSFGDPMSTTTQLAISGTDKLGNDISSFINSLTDYGNDNRRGYIKIEKENDPNFFQIYSLSTVTDNAGWFNLAVTVVRVDVGDETFTTDDPVSITFTPSGPQALTQDLSNVLTLDGIQTTILKTLSEPLLKEPAIIDNSFILQGVDINSNGVITCDPFDLSSVIIGAAGRILCSANSFNIGDRIYIAGSNSGTGTIIGYSNTGTLYYIISTNGTTEFVISDTLGGSYVNTTAGSVSGSITFTKVVFNIHDAVKVLGTNSGTGLLTGYNIDGSVYYITATNGRDTFTLSETMGGPAVTTTAGTVLGAMIFTSNVGTTITFEDSTFNNNFETRLSVINSSADHKIILPDATTTLVGIDNSQILSNKIILAPLVKDPVLNLTGNNKNITLTSTVTTAYNSRLNTTQNDQYSWTTNLVYDGASWSKDNDDRGGWLVNKVVTTGTDTSNQIQIAYASIGTNNAVNQFIFKGDGTLSLLGNVSSSNTTTGTLIITGGVGITENINIGGNTDITGILTSGSIQSTPIGSSLRESGGFTTLSASQLFDVSDSTESSSKITGAAVIAGGLGVGKAINVNGPIWVNNLGVTETKLTDYSLVLQGNQAKFRVGPNYTSGAIDYIDVITQANNPIITTNSDNLTIENAKNASLITLTATSGSVLVTANTASTTKTTGALQVVGGIGVNDQVHADDIYVYGQAGLSDASQVASVAATQTLTNKTLINPVIDNTILTGTVQVGGDVGIQGQLLSSTGTGVTWVNPVSFSAVGFIKVSDQNINPSGDVAMSSGASYTIGSSFGFMDNSGIFTFTVSGTYQVTLNFSLTDINGGSGFPPADFWIKKNNSNQVKYCQVLTNGIRRGSVSDIIQFVEYDTLIWFMNSVIRINGGTATGSRLSIIRIF
jgi:hypothetical protein